eukprot:CAMPEP_0194765646 /NCGR_PEP_ID=MMETSP0323_2-20130528/27029_1 /TAXON_ID=2866 ORGANISM="Crypthecodinium cohnii, Strain Seligo" /NCGR_SAMPLE_ID=MMETSP0323_2 /ASSEMBLY_ACC=CAM_ASM_000346 /LENGTH=146 /DNA_ID=CAMNT_0039695559 /DNA_START=41 /DNA_END=479 /DNA_ORIENTATION=+
MHLCPNRRCCPQVAVGLQFPISEHLVPSKELREVLPATHGTRRVGGQGGKEGRSSKLMKKRSQLLIINESVAIVEAAGSVPASQAKRTSSDSQNAGSARGNTRLSNSDAMPPARQTKTKTRCAGSKSGQKAALCEPMQVKCTGRPA